MNTQQDDRPGWRRVAVPAIAPRLGMASDDDDCMDHMNQTNGYIGMMAPWATWTLTDAGRDARRAGAGRLPRCSTTRDHLAKAARWRQCRHGQLMHQAMDGIIQRCRLTEQRQPMMPGR
jgi:hypothetical protein